MTKKLENKNLFFEKFIKKEIKKLLKQNKYYINIGNKFNYQLNCIKINVLSKILFLFKRIIIEGEHYEKKEKDLLFD